MFLPATPDITMRLVSAFKAEEDLQRPWREEREQQCQCSVERIPGRARVTQGPVGKPPKAQVHRVSSTFLSQ